MRLGRIVALLGVVAVLLAIAPQAAQAQTVPLAATPPAECAGPASCVVDMDVPLPDGVVVPGDERPGNRVRIVLPPGYSDADARPLLFLLHGAGDGSESWVENTDVEEFVVELCAIDADRCPVVVMPDGGGKHSETGWYTDWHDGSRQWETFHIEVALPWIRDQLGVGSCRESTLLAGLSMGGFGSFSYAGRHSDEFVAAASFSGFLDSRPAPPLSTVGFQLAQDNGLGAPTEDMFGPAGLPVQQDGWAEHNPTDLARAGAYAIYEGNLWLATGTGTVGGPAGDEPDNPGSYALESFIFELNQNFRLAMAQAGDTFHDQSYVGGNHAWPHWQLALRTALPEMLEVTAVCADAAAQPEVTDVIEDPAPPAPTLADDASAADVLPATGADVSLFVLLVVVAGLALRIGRERVATRA